MSEELTPMNHRELWLKAIATGTVPEWLEPMTHEELWLKAIAQGGGSGGGVLVVNMAKKSGSLSLILDKTWQEIADADYAVVHYQQTNDSTLYYTITEVTTDDGAYIVGIQNGNNTVDYMSATSASGYPETM